MMKRKVALLMTMVMLATSAFPAGITAYAEDAVVTDETALESTFDGTLEESADVPVTDGVVNVPDEDAGLEVGDGLQSATDIQSTDDQSVADIIMLQDDQEETTADKTVEDTNEPTDVPFAVDGIEVVNEKDIQTLALGNLGGELLSLENPVDYTLEDEGAVFECDIDSRCLTPGKDYTIHNDILENSSCTVYMRLSVGDEDREMAAGYNNLAFSAEENVTYHISLHPYSLYSDEFSPVKGKIWLGEKIEISSIAFTPMPYYDVFDIPAWYEWNLPAEITFRNGDTENIDTWSVDFYDRLGNSEAVSREGVPWNEYNTCLCATASNGETIRLLFYQEDGTPFGAPNAYDVGKLFVGEFTFEAFTTDGMGADNKRQIDIMGGNTVTVKLPSEDLVTVGPEGLVHQEIVSQGRKIFYIPEQESTKNLHFLLESFNMAGEEGWESVTVSVYKKSTMKRVFQGVFSETDSMYCNLEKDQDYLICIENYKKTSHYVTINFEDPHEITSITISGIRNTTYDVYEAAEVLYEQMGVDVEYADIEGETISRSEITDEESDAPFVGCKTKYNDIIVLELKTETGEDIDLTHLDDFLAPGKYELTAYVKGQEEEVASAKQSFTVECDDESFILDKDYSFELLANTEDEYRKTFSFEAPETGMYTFHFLSVKYGEDEGRGYVYVYDSKSNYLDSTGGETHFLKKGQKYYYVVGSYDGYNTKISMTIRLTKGIVITAIALESDMEETTYELDEDGEVSLNLSGMTVRVYYSDGSSQLVDVGDFDEYDNFIYYSIYRVNSGVPDKNNELYEDELSKGVYAVFACVNTYEDNGDSKYIETPTWTKITVVEKEHIHKPETSPRVDKKPTCTSTGEQSIHCSDCGEKIDGTTTIIPMSAHTWGSWTVTTAGSATRSRTCTVCHTSESQAFAPVLTLTDNKLTMKTKQSTSKFKVEAMAAGDTLATVTSSNTKLLKVSNVSPNGTFKLKAQGKTGTAKLTITLKSGLSKTIKVKIQKAKVKTTKIKVASKKLTLSKKQKYNLAAVVTPVTSYDKVKYTTSNKKVATVNKKGQITAKGKGKATITVKSGKKSVKVKVTVK